MDLESLGIPRLEESYNPVICWQWELTHPESFVLRCGFIVVRQLEAEIIPSLSVSALAPERAI